MGQPHREGRFADEFATLVAAAQAGGSFAPISKALEERLSRKLFLVLRNADDVREVLQDVQLKLYSKVLARLDPSREAWAYVRRMAVNEAISRLRAKGPGEPISDDECDEPSAPPADDPVEREELTAALRKAVGGLKPADQEIIRLRYHEDLSSKDIGQALGLSAGAVDTRLCRALDKLAEALVE